MPMDSTKGGSSLNSPLILPDAQTVSSPPDYIQLVHNHVKGSSFETLSTTGPASRQVHTVRLLVNEVEQNRTSAGSVVKAKKILAYLYLRSLEWVEKDSAMDAMAKL
ncbi:hypothetical protein DFP72DRAFT_1068903 [Ephemerocybe angulata]|uniref:Uncharacterized protein n=1 Tax=Ephemerocybe angulata TaxID=980116 RepID=A0A8H6HW81_9AGAR|nr:hypothetical protein DFP72DRAFT_1068903 [Tulosesus angulatus]